MDRPHPDSTVNVISLELQCLYSLVGRWEEYSSLALSLLPVPLRRKLIFHLPVADLCQLEEDYVFMNGIDSESIWLGLLNKRILLYPRTLQQCLKRHPSAKDVYFTEIAVNLLTSIKRYQYQNRYKFPILDHQECQFKSNLFTYMLFGTPLECDEALVLNLFIKQKSLGITWLIPNQYRNIIEEVADIAPMAMVKMFLNKFKWYPKILILSEDDIIDDNLYGKNRIYQLFMSQVETVQVEINDYRNYTYADSLESLWLALASSKPSSFSNIVLSACVTNLGDLISKLVETLFANDEKEVYDSSYDEEFVDEESVASEEEFDASPFYKFAGFKQIELLGNNGGTGPHEYGYPGYLSHNIHDFIPFLAFQNGLERLTIQGLENIVKAKDEERYGECDSNYDGFDAFYNYLPHIISKQTFKSLHVVSCKLPHNTVKSMISTFLSCQTSHNQSLQIVDCDIVAECTDTFSSEYPLIEPTTIPCVCGDYKSLSVCLNNSLFPQWLFEYPNLQLKRLEVIFDQHNGAVDLQSLEMCPFSFIKEFCCKLCGIHDGLADNIAKVIQKLIKPPSLSELELLNCDSTTADDGLLSVMTNIFSQPFQLTSLRRLKIQKLSINHRPVHGRDKIRPFFDTLFSMPKDQLVEFTLELISNTDFDYLQHDIFNAWKANSGGQKLKKFIHTIRPTYYCSQTGPVHSPINEHLSSIAIDSNVDIVLY